METTKRFVQETKYLYFNLLELLESIKYDSKYESTKKLAENYIYQCKILINSFDNAISSFNTDQNDEIIKCCKRYHEMFLEIHKDFSKFEGTTQFYFYPYDLILTLKRFINKYLETKNYELILRSIHTNNYSVIVRNNPLKQLKEILEPYLSSNLNLEVKDNKPKYFIFLSFPEVFGTDLLLHTLTLSHELMHIYDFIKKISDDLTTIIKKIEADQVKPLVDEFMEANVPIDLKGQVKFTEPPKFGDFYDPIQMQADVIVRCSKILGEWLKEIVADLLATRFFGISYLFSLYKLSNSLNVMDRHSDDHPSSRFRLKLVLEELKNLGYFEKINIFGTFGERLKEIEDNILEDKKPICNKYQALVEKHINDTENKKIILETIRKYTKNNYYNEQRFSKEIPPLLDLLKSDIPPAEYLTGKNRFNKAKIPSILNAGWVFYYNFSDYINKPKNDEEENLIIQRINKLISKAIEIIEFNNIWYKKIKKSKDIYKLNNVVKTKNKGNSYLSDSEIMEKIHDKDLNSRLVISPNLNLRLAGGGIDLRLGTKFIIMKKTKTPLIDPLESRNFKSLEFQEKLIISLNENIVLHPNQLILASTLEYICMPKNLAGFIESRSSFGRAGLVVATAAYVHPGYKGCPTFELCNFGETPIILYPGTRIAQIIIHKHLADLEIKPSRYACATEPQFAKLWDDDDIDVLRFIHKK